MPYEFSLEKDVDELDADEAREALTAFMDKYDDEATEFEQIESEKENLESEVADLEEKVTSFQDADSDLAAEVAEVTRFNEEEAKAGLSFSRKLEIVLEEQEEPQEPEFDEEEPETPEDPEFDDNGSDLAGLDFSNDEANEAENRARSRLESGGLLN